MPEECGGAGPGRGADTGGGNGARLRHSAMGCPVRSVALLAAAALLLLPPPARPAVPRPRVSANFVSAGAMGTGKREQGVGVADGAALIPVSLLAGLPGQR